MALTSWDNPNFSYDDVIVTYDGVVSNAQTGEASGLGSSSATFLRVLPRTGTDSGTGTESSVSNSLLPRTGSGEGSGTIAATNRSIAYRAVTSAGTSNQYAAFSITFLRTAYVLGGDVAYVQRTYNSPNFYNSEITYNSTGGTIGFGLAVRPRAGSASGTSSSSAVRIIISLRTGTGDGTGADFAFGVRAVPRTGTEAGQGTETGIGARTEKHIGTGNGVGSGVGTHPNVFVDGYWGTLVTA